ncbi:MAG: alkaline phosphatase family protein, partial [Thermoanaerobaculia bacterium]|nr:alkaline phosphatase family protein [Thermoanaerobaculia bacterium]
MAHRSLRPRRLAFVAAVALLATLPATALPAPGSRLQARPAALRQRVIFVGWDGADWKLLDPLMKEGRLPNLAALVAKGRTWNLVTYQPMASPLIWTTIATGRTPVDHGVTDFQ